MTHYYLEIIFMILVGIYGIGFVITGFQAMQRRRPIYNIHQGWSLGKYLFFFVWWTILLASFGTHFLEIDNKNISIESVLIVILISALLSFLAGVLPRLWRSKSTASATIHGINKKVLDLLHQVLVEEGIAYREMHGDFSLTDLNAVIYTTLWSDVG